ncbi:MAG: hypothetical protein AABY18_00640 [Candidatus Thermoplasmatota archaeon]
MAGATVLTLRPAASNADVLEAQVDPTTYAMQATSDLSRLGTLSEVSTTGLATVTSTEASTAAELKVALQDALTALDAALALAALPTIPEDYLPGTDLDVDLPRVEDYPVYSLVSPSVPLDGIRLRDVVISHSPVGPRSDTPINDLVGQVEALRAQVEDLVGQPVGGLPVEGLPVVGPIGGGLPGPTQDVDGTVDPDEEGAVAAALHAQAALGLTTTVYDTTAADLEELVELFEELAGKLDEAIALVRESQAEAQDGIDGLLEERLAGVEKQVRRLEAQASALVAAHATAVAAAQDAARQSIDDALAHGVEAMDLAGQATVRDLEAQAQAIVADAEARRSGIQAVVESAKAELGTGPDAEQALQAVEAAASAALLEIERDSQSQVDAVLAQVDGVSVAVQASQRRLEALASVALAEVGTVSDQALVNDVDVRDYLTAVAQARGVAMQARENELALEAVAQVKETADAQVEDLIAKTLAQTRSIQTTLARTGDAVSEVEDLLVTEVGKDLDYVEKVGDDYSRVPTDERKARATHWTGLATGLGGVLEDALMQGYAIDGLAQDVLAAAEQAESDIAAFA